jgi:hypothetical protein
MGNPLREDLAALKANRCDSARSCRLRHGREHLGLSSKILLLQGVIPACSMDANKHLKRVKWKNARTIDVRIRQAEFSPMIIGLTKDKPYILRIKNADDKSRNFKAGKFFPSVALSRVAINGKEKRRNCVTGVTVQPHQVAELALVAVRDGRYEFEDNFLSSMAQQVSFTSTSP